jgi:hypothetical protein
MVIRFNSYYMVLIVIICILTSNSKRKNLLANINGK